MLYEKLEQYQLKNNAAPRTGPFPLTVGDGWKEIIYADAIERRGDRGLRAHRLLQGR